jgi:G3E family GTPase
MHLLLSEVQYPPFPPQHNLLTLIRDSGVNAIESLMEKQGTFDYILLETTGLADPGNIAPLFWVDEGLGSTIYLDGIVTLIDAKNILKSLDEPVKDTVQNDEHGGHEGPLLTTAHLQISHADVIVINKSDLVSEAELLAVRERVEAINGLARIHVTQQGQVPRLEGFLLDLHAYDSVGALDVSEKGHSHLDPVTFSGSKCESQANLCIDHIDNHNTRACVKTRAVIEARRLAPIYSLGRHSSWSRFHSDRKSQA